MLHTQYICMLYGYDIPILSMITSGFVVCWHLQSIFFKHLRLRKYGMLPYTAARGCLVVYIVGFCRSEMLQTQYICMFYGYDIPFLSMITSGFSCVTVQKVYFSNTLGSLRMACYPILLRGVVWSCSRVDIVGFLLQLYT